MSVLALRVSVRVSGWVMVKVMARVRDFVEYELRNAQYENARVRNIWKPICYGQP